MLVLDQREVEEDASAGEHLPALIAGLRDLLSHDEREKLDDGLLDAGYLEADAARYQTNRFTRRSGLAFRVTQDFPCIVESMLPAGVGDVSYALSLAACAPFAVEVEPMLAALRSA